MVIGFLVTKTEYYTFRNRERFNRDQAARFFKIWPSTILESKIWIEKRWGDCDICGVYWVTPGYYPIVLHTTIYLLSTYKCCGFPSILYPPTSLQRKKTLKL